MREMARPIDDLPESVARTVHTAHVTPALRELFTPLPRPITLEVDLPSSAPAPLSVRQLVKLSLLGGPLALGAARVVDAGAPARLVMAAGERRFEARGDALASDARELGRQALVALFEAKELAACVDSFAVKVSKLTTIQRVVHAMLGAADVHHAVHAMLTGITSGDCLGFHRAVLFVRDGERGVYVGSQAVGPRDHVEARRIWEQIEVEHKSLDAVIQDYARHGGDASLQLFAQTLTLRAGADEGDEVTSAESAKSGVKTFHRARAVNDSLEALGPAREFALAAVRPHGEILGLIFVDDVFVDRPIDPERVRDLELFVDQAALIWDNFTLLDRVASLARRDSLTGLLNRRELEARFTLEATRVQSGKSFGLLLVDVDRFKEINDTRGHERGDEALKEIAAVLQRAVRGQDTVARFGGDEFVVLLAEVPRDDVIAAARRIGHQVRETGLSVSIGIATWPEDCKEMTGLFSVADANMYRAKQAGRGRAGVSGREPFGFDNG